MNDKNIRTLDDIRAFLEGTAEVDFSIENKQERYHWIERTLRRFRYFSLGRTDRGLVLRYLQRVSGYKVTELLEKLRIELTKSRPRHSNDNALAESKNGSVLRKHFGYEHIPGQWASQINMFHRQHFNPYLNFHRPCLFSVSYTDSKGRIKKRYPYEEMKTPYDKLKSLSQAEGFLKPEIIFQQLDAMANSINDNEAAKQTNEAKRQLFKAIFEQNRRVG